MKICVIENNLAGFLTAVYHSYYTHKDIDFITSDYNKATMLDSVVEPETDTLLARKVREGIIKKAGKSHYDLIYNAYLSCDEQKEQKLFEYLKLFFKKGRQCLTMYAEPSVIAFNDMLKKVNHEKHRMLGFLRFQEMQNGIYYAYFGSDNDVLELIIPHFTTRFNDQQFVIHDIKRKKMAYYDGAKTHFSLAPESVNITISDKEVLFSELWREYNQNVAIDNRKNIKLQNQYAPKKYRWFMNEF